MKKGIVSVLIVAVLIGAAGAIWMLVGGGSTPIEHEVTIATSKLEATTLVRVAQEQGFFEENGVRVTITEQDLGKFSLQEVLDGNADLATTAEFPVVKNAFERDDLRLVSTIHSSNTNVRILMHGDPEGIDLAGKRIATTVGTVGEFFLHLYLDSRGQTADDITIVDLPPAEIGPAFAAQEIDGFSLRQPHPYRAEQAAPGPVTTIPSSAVDEVYTATFNLVALADFADNNNEATQAVLQALIDAEEFVQAEPEQTQEMVAAQLGLDSTYLQDTWDDSVFQVGVDQSLLINMDDEARWRIDQGLTDRTDIPNFLDVVHTAPLSTIAPERVTVF